MQKTAGAYALAAPPPGELELKRVALWRQFIEQAKTPDIFA